MVNFNISLLLFEQTVKQTAKLMVIWDIIVMLQEAAGTKVNLYAFHCITRNLIL